MPSHESLQVRTEGYYRQIHRVRYNVENLMKTEQREL